MPCDVFDSRLQHFLKGKDGARRPFHHQPVFAASAATDHATCCVMPRTWPWHQAAAIAEWITTLRSRRVICSTTTSSQDNLVGVAFLREDGQGNQFPASGSSRRRPRRRWGRSRLPHHWRHHAGAQSIHRRFLPRDVQVSATRVKCSVYGRPSRASRPPFIAGGVGSRAERAAVHRTI